MWHDINFTEYLSRYIESSCFLANVRSATLGQPVQITNTQPFRWGRWLGVHNGFIENFRQTLYRPLRDRLSDICYNIVEGSTDSEHLFALFCNELVLNPQLSPVMVLRQTLQILFSLAQSARTSVSAAMILTDGKYIFGHPLLLWHTTPDPVLESRGRKNSAHLRTYRFSNGVVSFRRE